MTQASESLEDQLRRVLEQAADQLPMTASEHTSPATPASPTTRSGLRRGWARSLRGATALLAVAVAIGIGALTIALLSHGRQAGRPASPPLGTDHADTIAGSKDGLLARVAGLRGKPIVITVWASWCRPCRHDLNVVTDAAQRYPQRVAFLGVDTLETSRAAAAFLRQHPLGFASYRSTTDLRPLLQRPLAGVPTTIFIDPAGRVAFVRDGAYSSAAALANDIARHALKPQSSATSATTTR